MDALTCTRPDFVWSIEHHAETVIIRYNHYESFAILIKSFSFLKWDTFIKGWVAHKDYSDFIYNTISSHYPEWECIDTR